MVLDLNFEELDLSVFQIEFDPHKRGLQCIRTLNKVRANDHPNSDKKLSEHNKEKLLEYSAWMIRRIKRQELSISSFEKNLAENWKMCLHFGEFPVEKVEEAELKGWWEHQLKRYEEKEIKWGTLRKLFHSSQCFLKYLHGINNGRKLPLMDCLEIPKAPKKQLSGRMPTQEEVKQLIDAAYASNKYSLRNQAILALANDTGARISEMLSMRNKHIKPEKNYLVVSFPESKSMPRTVICYLAKPYLEKWAKVSPNKQAGPEAFFFCQGSGKPITYAAIKKCFDLSLQRSQIPWKKGKALHFFRGLFSTRAYDWPYTLKHYWLGWILKDHERAYTQIDYRQCVDQYFSMLKRENNPMLGEEQPFWNEQKADDRIIEQLKQMPEFDLLLRKLVRQT